MAHGKEYRIPESIVAKQVLVEQKNPNVGAIPGRQKSDCEKAARALHLWRRVLIARLEFLNKKTKEEGVKSGEYQVMRSTRVWQSEQL